MGWNDGKIGGFAKEREFESSQSLVEKLGWSKHTPVTESGEYGFFFPGLIGMSPAPCLAVRYAPHTPLPRNLKEPVAEPPPKTLTSIFSNTQTPSLRQHHPPRLAKNIHLPHRTSLLLALPRPARLHRFNISNPLPRHNNGSILRHNPRPCHQSPLPNLL